LIWNVKKKNENYLEHHGILGQKWGVKNGPPYPLGASEHSTSEKKANWRKSIDKSSSSKHTKNNFSKDDADNEKRGLTDKQKTAIKIGMAAAAVALAAYGTYKLNESGKLEPLIDKGKDVVDNLLGRGNDGGKSIKPESFIKKINPKYDPSPYVFDGSYKNNCANCAIAFDLQSRGLNVEARGNKTGTTIPSIARLFKGITSESFCELEDDMNLPKFSMSSAKTQRGYLAERGKKVYDIASRKIGEQFEDGSHGIVSMPTLDGGHAFNWVKNNGVVKFYDSQDPKRDVIRDVLSLYDYHPNSIDNAFTALRTDNLIPNWEVDENGILSFVKMAGNTSSSPRYDIFTEFGEGFILKNRLAT